MNTIKVLQKGIISSFLAFSLVFPPILSLVFQGEGVIPERAPYDPFRGYSILREICTCESNLSHYEKDGSTVLRGKYNSYDIGICQINEFYHKEESSELGVNIYTEEGNITYAKYLYDKEGVHPWKSSKKCWQKRIGLK